jgi:adenosylcobinamide kinase/adenosylcobinamide-phosphate guanylyltransferase
VARQECRAYWDETVACITLITGGARSGKSRYALGLAAAARQPAFIATAEPSDDEMRARIARHREERKRDARFHLIEAPIDLAAALRRLPAGADLALVDCLTVWLGNLMHRRGVAETYPEVAAFLRALEHPPCDLVLVTNEVGLGVVPPTEMGRAFRDLAGSVNQQIAARASTVVFMACGLPLFLKKGPSA